MDELAITVLIDLDYAHGKITRRSVTGMMTFVGRAPIFFSSKQQGYVETSSYGADSMRSGAAEEIILIPPCLFASLISSSCCILAATRPFVLDPFGPVNSSPNHQFLNSWFFSGLEYCPTFFLVIIIKS
jgi:hypothetical protein